MPHIDETKLRLLGRRFVLPEAVAIGGGGTEFFTFEPLAEGTTVIRMEYKRAWESTPVQEQVFRVQIDVARF